MTKLALVLVLAGCGPAPQPVPGTVDAGVAGITPDATGTAVPVLVLDPTRDSFPFPLRPELARPCARVERAYVLNEGGGAFEVTGFTSVDPAFSMQAQCAPVTRGQPCEVSFCFDSTIPGTHIVTGMVQTDLGYFETPMGVTVAAPTPDLDLSFHGSGGLAVDTVGPAYNNGDAYYVGGAIAAASGDSLMLWSRWAAITVDLAASEHDESVYAMVDGFLANWLRGLRDDGQHVYAVLGDSSGGSFSTIIRFDETGVRDTAFGQIDLPTGAGYYNGLELAPGGRILAIASQTVVAIAGGGVDPTWGANGQLAIDGYFRGVSAIDSQGRLYIGLGDHAVRVTAGGALDPAFTFAGTVGALAVDAQDRVLVGGAASAMRLDDTGAITATFGAPAAVTDIALDSLGRLYVTAAGQTLRYAADGTLDRALGMGSTRGVRCGGRMTCWLYGVEEHITPPEQEFDIDELYALRLAD